MNKSLLATTALIALVLPSIPAYAGPILDDLLGPSFTSWTATDDNIESDGTETYTGLSLEGEDEDIVFDRITLQRTDDFLTVDFEGLSSVTTGHETMLVSRGSLSADVRFFKSGLSMFDRLIEDEIETCEELDLPFRLQAHDVALQEVDSSSSGEISGSATNAESNITFGIDLIAIDYAVNVDHGDCIVDMDMMATGMSMNDGNGFAISIAELDGAVWWSLLNERVPQNLLKPYTIRFDAIDTDIAVGGMSELHINRISGNNSLDPGSMKALVESGYYTAYRDIITSSESDIPFDLSYISIPAFWNATADLVSDGSFTMSGLEITGDLAFRETGTKIFERGRKLDLSMDYTQNTADVSTKLSIRSDDLLDVNMNTDFVIEDMDMALDGTGIEMLMVAAPILLRSFSVELKDEMLGEILGSEFGEQFGDPYMMVETLLMGAIGNEKAALVAQWLGRARNADGTSFAAAPDRPIPVMQIFENVMGDWSALGKLINARTGE